MPTDSKPPRRSRDQTAAMMGAALRASRRNKVDADDLKPEKSGGMIVTAIVVVVAVFATLFMVIWYAP